MILPVESSKRVTPAAHLQSNFIVNPRLQSPWPRKHKTRVERFMQTTLSTSGTPMRSPLPQPNTPRQPLGSHINWTAIIQTHHDLWSTVETRHQIGCYLVVVASGSRTKIAHLPQGGSAVPDGAQNGNHIHSHRDNIWIQPLKKWCVANGWQRQVAATGGRGNKRAQVVRGKVPP